MVHRIVLSVLVVLGIASSIPSRAIAADPQHGKDLFQSRCAMCHSTKPGVNKIGPSLADILGRKAGTEPNFNYSEALKKSGIIWTAKALNAWLKNPHKFVPGDRMPFPGLASKTERADIVSYLESISRH